MCISDRCITIQGRTFNLETGYEWSCIINEREDQGLSLRFKWHQYLPYSTLTLSFVEQRDQSAFFLKNAANSRKLTILDRRRRDVVQFEMIDSENFMVEMQSGEFWDETYWTMLNKEGMILDTDKKMMDLLNDTHWTSVESTVWRSSEDGSKKVSIVLMAQNVVREDSKMTFKQTMRLHRQKKQRSDAAEREDDHMPEIGVIVMDLESKKVHFAQKYDKDKITEVVWPYTCTNQGEKENYEENKKHHESEQRKNLSAMKSNKVQCKVVLPEFDIEAKQ